MVSYLESRPVWLPVLSVLYFLLWSVDLHWNYLQPQGRDGVLTINKGACSRRSGDESYGLDSGNTPGISVPFNELSNRLNRSWCVSIVANTQTGNLAPLVTFYHNNLTEIGSIVLTQTLVNITVIGSSASFNFPRQQEQFEHVRLQLCAEENTLYFYYGCEPMGSQSFTNTGFSDSDVVGLLRDLTDNTIRGYMVIIILSLSGARDTDLECSDLHKSLLSPDYKHQPNTSACLRGYNFTSLCSYRCIIISQKGARITWLMPWQQRLYAQCPSAFVSIAVCTSSAYMVPVHLCGSCVHAHVSPFLSSIHRA